jgi:hypothetical protein
MSFCAMTGLDCGLSIARPLNLATVLAMGEKTGYAMPGEIVIFGIETENVTSFSTEPTIAVKNAIPCAVEMIRQTLLLWGEISTAVKDLNFPARSVVIWPKLHPISKAFDSRDTLFSHIERAIVTFRSMK